MKHLQLYFFLLLLPAISHAQWSKTNGLPGGDINVLLNYGDTVLAGAGSGLYFSSNHGQSWSPLPAPVGFGLFNGASDGKQILLARSSSDIAPYRFVRTNDFGQTYHPVYAPDSLFFYETLLVDDYIYGTDYQGVYRTNDDGAHWEKISQEGIGNMTYDGQRLTGLRSSYVCESFDKGITWDTLLAYSGNAIDMLRHDNYLFVLTQYASTGCYASSDNGQSWQHYTGFGFDQFYDFVWHNGAIFGLDGQNVYKSTNLGKTWQQVSLPGNESLPAFTGVSTGDAVLIGGIGYYCKKCPYRSSDNGDSWFSANLGIQASSGKLRTTGTDLYAPSNSGLFQLNQDAVNWTELHPNFTLSPYSYGYTDYLESGGNKIICDGKVSWVSLDGGQSWYESFVPSNGVSNYNVGSVEPVGDKIIAFADDYDNEYHFVSTNHGLTFQYLTPFSAQYQDYFGKTAVDQGKIYNLSDYSRFFRSDNGGDSWNLISDSVPIQIGIPFTYGYNLFVSGDYVVICSNYYPDEKMIISQDGGQNWSIINLSTAGMVFGNKPFTDLLRVGGYLIASNYYGVFISSDNGTTWADWSQGFNIQNITNLEIHNGYLWAGTDGNGIWKRALSELGMQPITGKAYWDENANGQLDAGETGISNITIKSTITNSYNNTRADGTYELLSNLAQEQITAFAPNAYWTVSPSTPQSISVPGTDVNFGFSLNPAARDLSIQLTNTSVFRPGFENTVVLSWRNNVPVVSPDASVQFFFPVDLLEWMDATPAPVSVSNGTAVWQLGALAANAGSNIIIRSKTPATTPLGTEICMSASIDPVAGDLLPQNNTDQHCVTVVGSYDPNDKQVEPERISPTQIAANQALTFTVRFQNTGNFPATFVRVRDTLQSEFDPATFRLLASSHPCSWAIKGKGIIEFLFQNIQLAPELLDEPGSHGFVKYAVQAKQDLPLGTPLRNTAHIFFDFNAPITTNTAVSEVGIVRTYEAREDEQMLRFWPNPASDLVRVDAGDSEGVLSVKDASGRCLMEQYIVKGEHSISVKMLPAGMFEVTLVGEKGIRKGKLCVQR